MTQEDQDNNQALKDSDWYRARPEVIRQAIDLYPLQMYRFKSSGKHCYIIGYEEPESDRLEDVTLIVQKTGEGGALAEMGLGELDTNQVFGVKPTDLEPLPDAHYVNKSL